MANTRTTHLLIVLDGFGYREEKEYNAIYQANTPIWDQLWQSQPHTLLHGSGEFVGLPEGQMGNSEVGHMHLGSGRTVFQDLTRISQAIKEQEFQKNLVLNQAIEQALQHDSYLHIMGLLSPGGVHSHEDHIFAMIKLAAQKGCRKVAVHAFLDGRDTPPQSAKKSLLKLQKILKEEQLEPIASISGRYFAMDRDKRWDRIEKALLLLTEGKSEFQAPDAVTALENAYARNENDEFVTPTQISSTTIQTNDSVIFMNFRADRARQLSQKLWDQGVKLTTLTQYDDDLKAPCAYPPLSLKNSLGEYLSQLNKTQLRIAETEKYAHVTFFFNAGREEPFKYEERILINSPKVATYDLQPEMSAPELTKNLVSAIQSGKFDVIVCNYANGDMVGHTGNFQAAIQAVETLDNCLKQVIEAIQSNAGHCFITSDHGNVEKMYDELHEQAHTAHTCEPVPLVYVGANENLSFHSSQGTLADVAPTILELMGLKKPEEMTGKSLLKQS